MNKRVGTFITQSVAGEAYKAYVPQPLPPSPPIDLNIIYPYLEKATTALAQLNAMRQSIPNISLFIYMYVRKEALLSSQIEGTQSSFSDVILFEHELGTQVSLDDVEEVSHYVQALRYGLERIKGGFPLSLGLLREMHAILLSGGRGSGKQPGEFRRSQNWIGGTRPGNARFVPPPVDKLDQCLSDLEIFIHNPQLATLIKVGLVHVQFETIHPFLDGNGRLGRLLITLMLCEGGLLDEPILYLSLYLKQHRGLYYELLQEVRTQGTWEVWLEFFLEGITQSAKSAIDMVGRINQLFQRDEAKIAAMGRARFTAEKVFGYMKSLPQVSASYLAQELNLSAPTIRSALASLTQIGILEEVTGNQRDRVYVYRVYLRLLEEGTEPL